MVDQKLEAHAAKAIKLREPGISVLVKRKEMAALKQTGQAPSNAYLPPTLDLKDIFALDVDAKI